MQIFCTVHVAHNVTDNLLDTALQLAGKQQKQDARLDSMKTSE